MREYRLVAWGLVLAAAVATLGCGGGGGGSSTKKVSDYVSGVSSSDGTVVGTLKSGSPPAASAMLMASPRQRTSVAVARKKGQRASAAVSPVSYPLGGTAALSVDDSATRVIVAIVGTDGYWELSGLTPTTGQTILVTFGQAAPLSFTLHLGSGDDAQIFAYQDLPVNLIRVGTGDVQVNVTWDQDVDVDLHVLDPSGEEIYYDNSVSASGGSLDLDSNAGCDIDGKNAENITWPSGEAPAGTYKVLVDYWEACISGTINYVVTVRVKGHAAQTFTGSFTDADADHGDTCFAGSGIQCGTYITSFTSP